MKKALKGYAIIVILAGLITSCQITDQELGEDLLPPGDELILFHDTIYDIHAYTVTATPYVNSERRESGRMMLLGNLEDTIVGKSRASVITQFNTNLSFTYGPNMVIDSLMLFLKVEDYFGDRTGPLTIRVYEFTERLYMDSLYYTNFNPAGKYDPVPLVEKDFTPQDGDTLEFMIEDQGFRDKFLALGSDTSLFRDDSIFKDYFNGLYIEAESSSEGGTMARIHLASDASLLSMKYANDSTQIDTTAGIDYKWSRFSIDEDFAQKINIFEHDHSGTHLATILDDEDTESPYCYVQGMAGVNTRFSFGGLEEWIGREDIAISSAKLVFEAVPEEESGIRIIDLPDRLLIGTILSDGSYEPIYDHYVLSANSQGSAFGGNKDAFSEGLFSDTTYRYVFKMDLHFQSMVDGLKGENDFILQLNDMHITPQIIKLWSNPDAPDQRIRLEIAYIKLY